MQALEPLPHKMHVPARRSMGASLNSSIHVKGGWGDDLERDMPVTSAVQQPMLTEGSMPRVMQPLRVEPPADYNAPARVQPLVAAKQAGVGGQTHGRDIADAALSRLARRPLIGAPTEKVKSERMKDYGMLEAACRRAGRATNAGTFSFNQAVLFDNMGEYEEAVRCYKDVLKTAMDAGDATAEALACNCIGVNLQMRAAALASSSSRHEDSADPSSDSVDPTTNSLSAEAIGLLNEAIAYHEQHVNVADVPGRFIAHSNLGLALQALNQLDAAAEQHEAALRYAIRMSSLAGLCPLLPNISASRASLPIRVAP
mmetsp:Transcript_28812/g.88337  ORF Transcript_28812/g.88337 Transcript_28812/m.88337 type:complete len:314 (+) Transcript_28812:2079-3020(+)